MKKKNVAVLSVTLVLVTTAATWLITGGWSFFMPPVQAVLPQDPAGYGEPEYQVLDASQHFWTAMERADETGMRAVVNANLKL